jgi:hypothetical protein
MKYSDNEIIELICLNPGYGIDRFVNKIYPKRRSLEQSRYELTMIMNDYLNNTGEDLFSELQDPEYIKWVTHHDFLKITGKNIPKGFGRKGRSLGKSGNKKSKASLVPLPPQEFNWGQIIPLNERKDKSSYEAQNIKDFKIKYTLIKLRNFRKIWEAYQIVLPVKSPTLVSKYLDEVSVNAVIKWVPIMCDYFENDVLEEWFEVTEILLAIEENNTSATKESMTIFRGTFEDYIKDPISNEPPSKEDIFWVFNQLI